MKLGGRGGRYCWQHREAARRRQKAKEAANYRRNKREREAREVREANEVQADQLTVLAMRLLKGLTRGL